MLNLHLILTPDFHNLPLLTNPQLEQLKLLFLDSSTQTLRLDTVVDKTSSTGQISYVSQLHSLLAPVMKENGLKAKPLEPVNHIGLIFANSWAEAKAFNFRIYGLMFDYAGPTTPGLPNMINFKRPREGAVIFVDELRALNPAALNANLLHTCIHELGHIFNLVHDSTHSQPNPTYMAEEGFAGTYFSNDHQSCLSLAGKGDPMFAPGGNDFRLPGNVGNAVLTGSPHSRTHHAFRFKIELAKSEFILGETVVLDLALTARSKGQHVTRKFDPGHSQTLAIWFQTPEGETRRYRPQHHFCAAGNGCAPLSTTQTLQNNPRISIGSRGLTFRSPGPYRLWATLDPHGCDHRKSPLHSNIIEFNVRLPKGDREIDDSLTMRHTAAAAFIANKGGPAPRSLRNKLRAMADAPKVNPFTRHARYALAAAAIRNKDLPAARKYLKGLKMQEESLKEGAEKLRKRAAS